MASDGVLLFALGFAKKVLIADSVGPPLVTGLRTAGPRLGRVVARLRSATAIQIYFDFSGYSDMAIGLGPDARLPLPGELPHRPTARTAITELWRRWHISLSTWLRDYLYIRSAATARARDARSGTSRSRCCSADCGTARLGRILLAGAAWHGMFLVLERRMGKVSPYGRLPLRLQVFLHVT